MDIIELLKRLLALDIKINLKPFNLMGILYENVYKKEETQSRMIAGLLDPHKKHDFDDLLIKEFFKAIGVECCFEDIDDINLETERLVEEPGKPKRYIDILITFKYKKEEHAIIIESKIHNAKDQEGQLDDYYKRIERKGYIVDKIVYIPINKDYRKPSASNEIMEKIVSFDIEDLINWLEKCIIITRENDKDSSALVQYKEFLKYIIDKNINAMEIQKIINEFNNLQKINKLEEIPQLIQSNEWAEGRFKLIVDALNLNAKNNLKQKYYWDEKKYCCYSQFYFEQYEFWIELWLKKEKIHFYLVSKEEKLSPFLKAGLKFEFDEKYKNYFYYESDSFEYPNTAEDEEMQKIKEKLLPIIDELESYEKEKNS